MKARIQLNDKEPNMPLFDTGWLTRLTYQSVGNLFNFK